MRAQEELLQLSFRCLEDDAKQQWTDEGVWMSLTDGRVFKTLNYRPYKAAKYVKADDSFFEVRVIDRLYLYPGEANPRVRWESADSRAAAEADYQKLMGFAKKDYAAVIKEVRGVMKDPLSDKKPIHPLNVYSLQEGESGQLSLTDEKNNMITLRLEQFGSMLRRCGRDQTEGAMLLCRFDQDMEENLLYATPLALVNAQGIVRFYY